MKSCGVLGMICVAVVLSSCGNLPTSGPSQKQINGLQSQNTQEQQVPDVAVVDINEHVVSSLYAADYKQSLADFGASGSGFADRVGEGDVLEITLWEAPPAVLFGGSLTSLGSGAAQTVSLPPQAVNSQGMISMPFLGNVSVSGKTPAEIRRHIIGRLKKMANQPQAMVRVVQNNSSNVTVIRSGKSLRMPLTGHHERVLDAVAAVGGADSNIQDISVQLARGNMVRTVALEKITADPSQNVVLRSGDVLTLLSNPFSFTALGALGRNRQVGFSAKGMNLGEALGTVGGLQDRRSNAGGVFVFRYQPVSALPDNEQGRWLDKGYSLAMDVPTVYRMDLSNANSLFWLQRFPIKNKDIVYVANAPLAEVQKFLQFVFSPVVSGVNSINNLGE